jgi:predicted MFS family arabinose efflux permease
MTRLDRMVRALLLFECVMYTVVAPLLPHYAHALHASKGAVGLLAAGYSAGLLPGALLGGRLATDHGVRRTTLAGLAGFAVATLAFGLVHQLVLLDLLRLVQGAFAGLIWSGALTWVIAVAPAERRAGVIAGAVAAATFGTLLGPLLGTLAVAAGTAPVFAATGIVALGLLGWAARHPEPAWCPPAGAIVGQLRGALRAGGFGLGAWLIVLEAVYFAAAGVLLPLRMSHLGTPGWAIGVVFAAASGLSVVLSPVVARGIDRRGASPTVAIGLLAAVPLIVALLLPTSAVLLDGLAVVALGAPMTAVTIPAVSMMTGATERAGVTLVLATSAFNVAYAVGETIGAPAAAGIAQATSDAVPLLAIAAMLLATLPFVHRPARASARAASELRPAPR